MANLWKYIHDIELPEKDSSDKLIEYQREQIEKLIKQNKALREYVEELEARLGVK